MPDFANQGMVENYNEFLTAVRANIRTSFAAMQKPAVLQVLDTVIGIKAAAKDQASSSGINDPPAQGNMQIG